MLAKCEQRILVLSVVILVLSCILGLHAAETHGQTLGKLVRVNRQGQRRLIRHKVLRQAATRKPSPSPPGACKCMDYWDCVSNNGQVYSYCGISDSEVCCFNNDKAKSGNDTNVTLLSRFATTTFPPTVTFSTGNEVTSNDFATATPSPVTPPATDVDYFFSLEDGIDDLKHVSHEKITEDSNTCGVQAVPWSLDFQAQFKEWPWHVALLESSGDLYICGGTLVLTDNDIESQSLSSTTVITAAHCVNPYRNRGVTLKVRAGEYDVSRNNESEPYIESSVETVYIHPNFNNATLANDIAIVKLTRPLNYTSHIRPVCLPLRNISISSERTKGQVKCVIVGWGRATEASPFSLVMKEVVVPLWSHAACENQLQQNFGANYKLSSSAICAGERGHDACDGDGGGGLVCFNQAQQRWSLEGVVSFGIGCGRQGTPGVYTKISSFLNWINA